jgi:hypothetical protein
MKASLAGGALPTVLASGHSPVGIVVDDASVYWAEAFGPVFASPKIPPDGGAAPLMLASGDCAGWGSLAVDATAVYWLTTNAVVKWTK